MEPENFKASKSVRVFTLKEANDLLPIVSQIFEKAFFLNQKIKSLTGDIENLVSIWGKDVLENGHIDNEYYFHMVSQRETSVQELMKGVNELQSMGCVVKDLDNGLVDFYCNKGSEIVFLCWKYGEDKIEHWHALDGGFRNRTNIKNLK